MKNNNKAIKIVPIIFLIIHTVFILGIFINVIFSRENPEIGVIWLFAYVADFPISMTLFFIDDIDKGIAQDIMFSCSFIIVGGAWWYFISKFATQFIVKLFCGNSKNR